MHITFRESQALRVAKVYPFTFYLSFSGEQLDGKLTIERFLAFQSELQREILSLEFHRKSPDPQTGTWNTTNSQFLSFYQLQEKVGSHYDSVKSFFKLSL